MLGTITGVFVLIADSHKFLTKEVVKGLREQIHQNTLLLSDDRKDFVNDTRLQRANDLLISLSFKIQNKAPIRLYEKLPLTSENIFKLMGCLALSLFATAMRALISLEDIKKNIANDDDLGVEL